MFKLTFLLVVTAQAQSVADLIKDAVIAAKRHSPLMVKVAPYSHEGIGSIVPQLLSDPKKHFSFVGVESFSVWWTS